MSRPASILDDSALTKVEKDGVVRGNTWKANGNAYALEQATRPSTIGFVLSSNPLALLAWCDLTLRGFDHDTDVLQDRREVPRVDRRAAVNDHNPRICEPLLVDWECSQQPCAYNKSRKLPHLCLRHADILLFASSGHIAM